MFNSSEKLATPKQEIGYLAHETHKLHLLQEEPGASRKEAAREVINRYAKAEAGEFLHETSVLPVHEAQKIILNLKPEAHDHKIEELFGLMMEKGVKNVLDIISKMNNPHLEDDFHRFLVQYLHTIGAVPGLEEDGKLARELNHTLFSISLPSVNTTENTDEFKKFIQAMKQFFVGMMSIADFSSGEYYTLELAVQNQGRDITVYAAVPWLHVDTFEKLVRAYYPGVAIEEVTNDYNIFSSEGGAIAGSIAKLVEPSIFPLSTDETFEYDPLLSLISSLSKLENVGEGAAIQFIITNDIDNSNKFYQTIINSAEHSRQNIKDIYNSATTSIAKGFGKRLLSFFESDKEGTKKEENKKDTRGIELVTKKNQSPSLSVGIRIIASAQALARAQSILSSIKASFNQFAVVGSNSIDWTDIKTNKINDFAKDFSFRTFNKNEQMNLSVAELATLFHFPTITQ